MALLRKLDADIPPVEDVPLDSAMTTDGMTLVHQIRTSKMTFEEFAIKLLCNILPIGQNSERINVVFDVSRDSPIKDIERKKRSCGNRHLFVGIESTCWNQIKKKQTPAFYFILKMPARTTRIVINLPDTNVFTLALSQNLFQSTQTCTSSLVSIKRSLTHLWDSVSAFAGRGKTKPFVLMCKRPDHIKAFSNLGKYEKLPDQCLRR